MNCSPGKPSDRKYHILTIYPNKEGDNKQILLFQFSELTGPLNGNGNGGTPVTLEIVPEQKEKDLTIIKKKQKSDPSAPTYDKTYYRVPDMVPESVGPEVYLNTRKLVFQFGEVIQLPANYIIGK